MPCRLTPRLVPNPSPCEGFGRTTCPLLTQNNVRPTRAAPRAARRGTRRVTRIRGAGREEGPQLFGAGALALPRLPHRAPRNGTAQTLRLPVVHHGGGQVGQLPARSPQPSILRWTPTTASKPRTSASPLYSWGGEPGERATSARNVSRAPNWPQPHSVLTPSSFLQTCPAHRVHSLVASWDGGRAAAGAGARLLDDARCHSALYETTLQLFDRQRRVGPMQHGMTVRADREKVFTWVHGLRLSLRG